jgi:hypothetical protein
MLGIFMGAFWLWFLFNLVNQRLRYSLVIMWRLCIFVEAGLHFFLKNIE